MQFWEYSTLNGLKLDSLRSCNYFHPLLPNCTWKFLLSYTTNNNRLKTISAVDKQTKTRTQSNKRSDVFWHIFKIYLLFHNYWGDKINQLWKNIYLLPVTQGVQPPEASAGTWEDPSEPQHMVPLSTTLNITPPQSLLSKQNTVGWATRIKQKHQYKKIYIWQIWISLIFSSDRLKTWQVGKRSANSLVPVERQPTTSSPTSTVYPMAAPAWIKHVWYNVQIPLLVIITCILLILKCFQ